MGWLRRHDPGLGATRRAARVTLAVCVGFYTARYGLGRPVVATYAAFGAIALGALSSLVGTPAQRTTTLAWALPTGIVLITLGTLLCVSPVSGVLGMFVVGCAVAFAGVLGPTVAGVANGLQLLYILPSIPPYDPDAWGERVAGLTLGLVLLGLADRFVLPDPGPRPYRHRLADAADAGADYLEVAAAQVRARVPVHDRAAPAAARTVVDRHRARSAELRGRAVRAMRATNPSAVPPGVRPVSASRLDRGMADAARHLRATLTAACRLVDRAGATPAAMTDHGAVDLDSVATSLETVGTAMRELAATLGEGAPPPTTAEVMSAHDRLDRRRLAGATAADQATVATALAVESAGYEAEVSVQAAVTAVRVALGVPTELPPRDPADPTGPFWYAHASPAHLAVRRLVGHLHRQSVALQNALRVGTGLALAWLLMELLDLQHGFWVMLSVLVLMRTSAADTRATLRPALTGTLVGSVVAGALLVVAGPHIGVYQVVFPVALATALMAGPLAGLAWGQGCFTVVVAMLFGQVAPTTWRLAEMRVVDVAVGAVVGALIGAVMWPRGATGQLARRTAELLVAGTAYLRETGRRTVGLPTDTHAGRAARRARYLAEMAADQVLTERAGDPAKAGDIQGTLLAARRVIRGCDILRLSFPQAPAMAWAGLSEHVVGDVDAVADAYERLAATTRDGQAASSGGPPPRAVDPAAWVREAVTAAGPDDDEARRALAVAVWLTLLQDGVTDLVGATATAPG